MRTNIFSPRLLAMFDYTRASIKITIQSLRKYARIFKYCSLVFTCAYFVYAIWSKTGIFYLNVALASLFLLYTIFDLITERMRSIKRARKIIKRSYGWVSLVLKLVSLGAMIYGIYNAATNVAAISTILATLMIILWVLQVFMELVIAIIEDKYDLILAGWKKDIEDIMMPKTKVDNFFKRIRGQEVPPPPEKSKELLILEKKMQEMELGKKPTKAAKKTIKESKKDKSKVKKATSSNQKSNSKTEIRKNKTSL